MIWELYFLHVSATLNYRYSSFLWGFFWGGHSDGYILFDQRLKFRFIDLNQWFSTGDDFAQVTFDNIWRYFWSSQLGWRSHCHLEGGGQEKLLNTPKYMWVAPSPKAFLGQNLSSVRLRNWSQDEINVNKMLEKIHINVLVKLASIMSVLTFTWYALFQRWIDVALMWEKN